ncbi:MAG TPA: CHAT domain-containing protein [Saprospiraceae bacterium]|nr:CHAT domain-containing protein [Saprospiraceae bacterium]
MKWFTFLLLSCLILPLPLPGQNADSIRADGLAKAAIDCLKRGEKDSAADLHRQALDFFSTHDYWIAWMQSHVKIAYTWAGPLKQPFVGIEYIERAIQAPPRQPKSTAEWEQLCLTYLAIGFIYEENVGDFLAASRQYEKGFQIFLQQLGERSDPIAGYIYYRYGNLCTRLGDYERAQNILQRGIDYGKKYQLPKVGKYGDLAIVLLDLNKNQEAISIVQEGLLHEGSSSESLITLRRSEARAYLNLGNITSARNAAAQIPPLIRRLKAEGSNTDEAYYWSGYYEALAAIDLAAGKTGQSIDNYKKSIKYETESWGTPYRREVGKLHWQLGDLYLSQNKAAAAIQEFQQTLQSVLTAFKPNDAYTHPPVEGFYAENTIIEGLEGKARAFAGLDEPEKALTCYELIPLVEAKLRATHAYESSSLLALDESRKRFDAAITIAWQLYETSNHDRRYAERAFLLSEKARGILLLHSLMRAQADYGLPANVRKQENILRAKMSWYDHEIAGEKENGAGGDAGRLKQLEKELFELKQEQERFKTYLRDSFPDYARLSEEVNFLTAGNVSALLRPEQAMVSFYLTDSDAFIFYFDAAGMFSWRKAVLPEGFRDMAQGYADYLFKGDENDKNGRLNFLRVASLLYDILLAPELRTAAPGIRSLLIIPDAVLVIIPFETLLRQPADTNWRKLPWLLRDYNIGYAYSATLLKTQQDISLRHRQETAPRYTFGGFAPAYTGAEGNTRDNPLPNYPLPDIKSTRDELRKVYSLTGGKAYYQDDATEKQFRRIAADCRTLLLAMHGFVNDEHPELSCLMFGIPNKDTSLHNNVLYASELQIMQLHADLVVLSACHTGSGKLHQGEGVYSLARAFAAAGVPCTVMSLWRLHENPAPQLVEAFFKHLKAGKTKDEALRLAKLEFIDNDKNGEMLHPFYWAGLMATGDMCVLDLPHKNAFPAWFYVVMGLVLFSLLFRLRRQKRR